MLAVPSLAVNVAGTGGKDHLRGTPHADRINGRGGNDRIRGLAGNDTLSGGPGNDTLTGGLGHDHLYGGRGDDHLLIDDRALDYATCGLGEDRVTADTRDIVRRDCETVLRLSFRRHQRVSNRPRPRQGRTGCISFVHGEESRLQARRWRVGP